MSAMTPAISELYNNQRVRITESEFSAIRAKAKRIEVDLQNIAGAVKSASKKYEDWQSAHHAKGQPVKSFALSIERKRIYPLPQGSIHMGFNFTAGEQKATCYQGVTSNEGLNISFNPHSNGFFDVLCFLAPEAGGRCGEGQWLRASPKFKDAYSYDVKPDAIATVELWLGQNYPPQALAFFRQECKDRGLVAAASAPKPQPTIQ